MKTNRRQFMILSAAGAASLALNNTVQAQAMVSPTDPQAVARGYVDNATKVDKAKFPKYVAGSNCSNCALYQGKAGAAAGGLAARRGLAAGQGGRCAGACPPATPAC